MSLHRILANVLLLLAFLVADRWLDGLGTSWSETARTALFGVLFAVGVAVNWHWIVGFWQPNQRMTGPHTETHRVSSKRWRLAFLVTLLGVLAGPGVVILAGRSFGAAWVAGVGVPMAVLVVLTAYAVLYRPRLEVLPTYCLGAALLCFVGYLVWQLVQQVLIGAQAPPSGGGVRERIPLVFLVVPLGLMVIRALAAMRRPA